MENEGDLEKKGLKRLIKLRVTISTNRPSLEGLDLDDLDSGRSQLWHLAPLCSVLQLSRPTIVYAMFVLDQLGDIDTARSVANVRMTMTMYWHDPRLKQHHKLGSPLPETLWAPNPQVKEAILGDFEVKVLEFTRMQEQQYAGDIYTVTSYGGTITNPMDLHLFPFDYNDIKITFLANSCQLRDGTSNVAFKVQWLRVMGESVVVI
jgi:hypothetical protein